MPVRTTRRRAAGRCAPLAFPSFPLPLPLMMLTGLGQFCDSPLYNRIPFMELHCCATCRQFGGAAFGPSFLPQLMSLVP